jgi:hypothetical protein
MRNLFILILIIIPFISFGQYNGFTLSETLLSRQPSARAEAMGRAYTSIDGDLSTVFFNPAGVANIKGLEINGSLSDPNYPYLPKARYYYTSIGYKFNKYFVIGLTRNRFTFGEKIAIETSLNNNLPENSAISMYKITYTTYTLTLSSQPVKNLFIGLNTNCHTEHNVANVKPLLYFDFGLIKKFQLIQNKTNEQSLNIGASITNLNSSKITYEYNGSISSEYLPVINRYGANYQLTLNKPILNDSLHFLRFLLQGEYQMLLNYKYTRGFHAGTEIMFLDLFCFRAGYYNENKDTRNYYPGEIKSRIDIFTYGFGFQIPFYKLTKLPLNVNIDYTSLPKASFSYTDPFSYNDPYYKDKFTTINIRINWMLKK